MLATSTNPPASAYHLRAWPIIYGTLLITSLAVLIALPLALLSAIFIVELAPAALRRVMIPRRAAARLRALGHLWPARDPRAGAVRRQPPDHRLRAPLSLQDTVQLTGAGLAVAVVVLAVMITPIMVALICDALGAVPAAWREGAAALGVNRLRAIRAVTLRAVRPAIVAATVLATARALGEAIMISMVSGSVFFAPRPGDGLAFLFEPLRTLASTIVDFHEGTRSLPRCRPPCTPSPCCCCSPPSSSRSPATSSSCRCAATRCVDEHVRLQGGWAGGWAGSRRAGRWVPIPSPARAGLLAAHLALERSPRAARRLGRRSVAVRDHRRDRPLHGPTRHSVPAPRADLLPSGCEHRQSGSGGFLDPLIGTALLTVIGIAIAAPLAICCALWIVEYGQGGRAKQLLTRVVESSIEIVAGTPDIVIAFFGLAIFQLHLLAFASFTASGGGVYGRSFLAAGAMMSLIALPPLFVAVRDGLQAVPAHMREAAFALGKTRIATIRRVLLPAVRANLATGVTLGVSRIIADTAIVIVLLGDALRIEPGGSVPGLSVLRGTGSTLTSYVYDNSPAGEGAAPQKAYAAAFVLMAFVLLLNLAVERISRARSSGFAVAEGIA